MSKPPYPNFPPSFKAVRQLGGHDRTCLAIELLSSQPLSATELAQLQECIELALSRFRTILENFEVVTPDRFDRVLMEGLRL